MSYFSHDDIAQIGTPPGPAPVGALRISGDGAFAILSRVACLDDAGDFPVGRIGRGVHSGLFSLPLSVFRRNGIGSPVRVTENFPCPARFFLMPGPASYTREDVAEVHLPGAPVILRAALSALVAAGARAALPGEFTFRAFRNGRLSLAQAEAVEELVRSGSDAERRRALSRLGDRDVSRATAWIGRTLDAAARVEAALDFSEEELDCDPAAGLLEILADLEREGLGDATSAATLPESGLPRVALVGLPNAGKSSLFNALLADDVALVSPFASTTRDSLRRDVEWAGVKMVLSDNPGFFQEGKGVGRAAADRVFLRQEGEDLLCWVVDGSRPPGAGEREFAARLRSRFVLAINKCDLPLAVPPSTWIGLVGAGEAKAVEAHVVSAETGAGLDELKSGMSGVIKTLADKDGWNRRETLELAEAVRHIRNAATELTRAGRLELAAEDIREAVAAFSRALGNGYAEDAIGRIFSRFCIGK